MADLFVPRSAVAMAVEALAPHFPGVPIASKEPEEPWPSRWIRVTRTGGAMAWAVDHARLLVECWASRAGVDDPVQAEADALLAYAALGAAPGPVFFDGDSITALNHPDYARVFARVQFSGTLGVPR